MRKKIPLTIKDKHAMFSVIIQSSSENHREKMYKQKLEYSYY